MPWTVIRARTSQVSNGWRIAAATTARAVAGAADPRTDAMNGRWPGSMQRDGERQLLARFGHAHPVVAVDRVERRDVELLLGLGPPGVVGTEQVAVPLVVGVVHLGDHAHDFAVPS